MACPIVTKAHRELTKVFFDDDMRYLYEDLLDRWEEIGSDANTSEPSEQALRLRGFYIVGLLSRICYTPQDRTSVFTQPRHRSVNGLSSLIQDCSAVSRQLRLQQVELQLLGQHEADMLVCEQLEKKKRTLQLCAEIATILRARMAGGAKGFTQMGFLFASALREAKTPGELCCHHLETVLRIDIHNPISSEE